MFNIVLTQRFEKDMRRMQKRKVNMQLLFDVIQRLRNKELRPEDKDHALKGEYHGCRECHVSSDWICVYEKEENVIFLRRTGTHSDIFKKKY